LRLIRRIRFSRARHNRFTVQIKITAFVKKIQNYAKMVQIFSLL